MKIFYQKVNENARQPEKATRRDFCDDLYAVSEEEIAPNVWKYKIGLRIEMDLDSFKQDLLDLFDLRWDYLYKDGYLYHNCSPQKLEDLFIFSLDIRPRSSIWKTGMVLANCEGTVDELYRGEIMAIFYHVLPNMPRYKVGDKIAQAKVGITPKIDWVEKQNIDTNTDRGEGGFGHSGN